MSDNVEQPAVEMRNVQVSYGKTVALHDCSLTIARGETIALLGPSGSGKSTALKAIAGFEIPSAGHIFLDGRDVTLLSPARRGIGVVVQSYALFPHLSVEDNVAFGLTSRKWAKSEIHPRVLEALRMVGMETYAKRLPRELSGGQQQRVAIARALAIKPPVLLLDEPLAALDARLRQEMLGELQQLRKELPDTAIVYVTHDQSEALALADRIGLMRDGRLVDLDSTEALYNSPPSEFSATFLGGSSIIPATATADAHRGDIVRANHAGHEFECTAQDYVFTNQSILVSIRPWAWKLSDGDDGFEVTISSVQWRGASYRIQANILNSGLMIEVDVPALGRKPEVGTRETLTVAAHDALILPGDQRATASSPIDNTVLTAGNVA